MWSGESSCKISRVLLTRQCLDSQKEGYGGSRYRARDDRRGAGHRDCGLKTGRLARDPNVPELWCGLHGIMGTDSRPVLTHVG